MSVIPTMVTGDLAFGAETQMAILTHMAYDLEMHSIADRVDLEVQDFDLPTCKVVFEALHGFVEKYGTLPPMEILAREVQIVATNQRGDAESDPLTPGEYEGLLYLLDRIARPGALSPVYYRDELLRYAKAIRARKLHMEAAEAIQQGVGVDDFIRRAAALEGMQSAADEIQISDAFEDPRLVFEKQAVVRIPTGLDPLDHALYGGTAVGEVGLVVACTGVGKSNTMLNIAKSAAALGWHALVINTEMKEPDMRHRVLSMAAHIEARWLQRPMDEWPESELKRLCAAMNSGYKSRINIADLSTISNPTMFMVERAIKMWRMKKQEQGVLNKAKLVLLDWIGEIRPKQSYVGREGSDLGWQGFVGNMKDYTRMIRKYECSGWTATQGTKDADGVKFLTKRHVAFSVRQLDAVDIAIGVTANDDDKLMVRKTNDDDAKAFGAGQSCDRLLQFATIKNRRFAPTAFPIYQGPSLGFFSSKQACQVMDRRVAENPFAVAEMVE